MGWKKEGERERGGGGGGGRHGAMHTHTHTDTHTPSPPLPSQQQQQQQHQQDAKTKVRILDALKEYGHAYGLNAVTYQSFVYRNGYDLGVAASDVVYAVQGILNHADGDESVQARVFRALDCLSMKNKDEFEFGVRCAKEQVSVCKRLLSLTPHALNKTVFVPTHSCVTQTQTQTHRHTTNCGDKR